MPVATAGTQRPGKMFDLTSSKLLILAVVALLVVGPKDLPALLRTVGRYLGMIKRQADEFRAQFEEAMRESEIAELKKEVEDLGKEAKETLGEATRSVEAQIGDVNRELNETIAEVEKPLEPKAELESLPQEVPQFPDVALPEPSDADAVAPKAPPTAAPPDRPRVEAAAADAGAGAGRSGA